MFLWFWPGGRRVVHRSLRPPLIPPQQQHAAQQTLAQFQEHPDAWQRVPMILEGSNSSQAKVRSRVALPDPPIAHDRLFNTNCPPYTVYRSSNPREAYSDALEGDPG